jgi:hypothetical protein
MEILTNVLTDLLEVALSEIERQQELGKEFVFRADAAFAKPEIYQAMEERGVKYAIRLPANDNLLRDIEELLTLPIGMLRSCSRLGFIVTNLEMPSRAVVRFYNKRGTAEQWIKEGKQAVKMTRLSCHRFRSNQVRLALSLLAYIAPNRRRFRCPSARKSQ